MKAVGWGLILTIGGMACALQRSPGQGTQSEGTPVFEIDFSNPGLIPAHWVLTLHPDGSGHFHSDRGTAGRNDGPVIEAPDVDRVVQVSAHFAEHVFEIAQRKQLFRRGCESREKVAFQGEKKLTYTEPDGRSGSCTFNFSKDGEIQTLGDALVSVAATLIEGARLQTLLQHDPLGLDREMEAFADMAQDGRAQQIGSIRDIMERLSQDPAVMERVRKRASALLARAND